MERVELYGTAPGDLAVRLGGRGRADRIWRAIRAAEDPFAAGILPEAARRRLRQECLGIPAEVRRRETAVDGTCKLLLSLRDGDAVEAVVIPGRTRTTVCVSTQVGCARDCRFCVTAGMGLLRSLGPAEIVAQAVVARREAMAAGMPGVRNVVFMGMGEPLDNLDATLQALTILTDDRGLAVGPRHITVSTVGTSPTAILRLAATDACLAWSIHAVDDDLRRRLIPTSRHPMTDLREAFLEVTTRRQRTLFVEMTLLDGVNDSVAHAGSLAAFLEPFRPGVRINLLPMNPGREQFAPSRHERAIAFRQHLRDRGLFCALRRPRGADLSAACGQLALLDVPSHR